MSQAPASGPRLIRFGVFELDPGSGELRKSGVRLSLQQQPLQVLTLLLEQPGKLVTRDALRDALWIRLSLSNRLRGVARRHDRSLCEEHHPQRKSDADRELQIGRSPLQKWASAIAHIGAHNAYHIGRWSTSGAYRGRGIRRRG
jgi:DNA-binding response OmpR family regulator